MAAAAARAALVAMQKRKKKKENMLKNLSGNANFDEDDRLFLRDSLRAKEDTKFLGDVALGDADDDEDDFLLTPSFMSGSRSSSGGGISAEQLKTTRSSSISPSAQRYSNSSITSSQQQKPLYISERHFEYLMRRFCSTEPGQIVSRKKKQAELNIWLDAYQDHVPRKFRTTTIFPRPTSPTFENNSTNRDLTSFPSSLSTSSEGFDIPSPDESNEIESNRLTRQYLRVHRYNEFVLINQIICHNDWFHRAIVVSILAAGVLVGIQSYPQFHDANELEVASILIQVVFSMECFLKIFSEGCHPLHYWTGSHWKWNNFDFLIVVIGWIPLGANIRIVRLLRLLRLFEVANEVKQFHMILMGLLNGFTGVTYIILLMLLIFYLFAVMGVSFFRQNDPFHFGSLGVAMLSLFRISTLEDWADIMYINMYGCDSAHVSVLPEYPMSEQDLKTSAGTFSTNFCSHPESQQVLSVFFFVSFVLASAFVIMALFVGAVTNGMCDALDAFNETERKERELKEKEMSRLLEENYAAGGDSSELYKIQTFRKTFDVLDKDCSGLIDAEELTYVMRLLGVKTSVEIAKEMIQEVDVGNKGGLDFKAFVYVMTDGIGAEETDLKPARRMSIEEQEQHKKSMLLSNYIRRAWNGEIYKKFEVHDGDLLIVQMYLSCAIYADKICTNKHFNHLITATIILAGVLVGIDTEHLNISNDLMNVLDGIVLTIFSLEIVLKLMSEGDEPWRYFHDHWNCFDLFIVGGCFVFMLPFLPNVGSLVAMLRLLRLLRVLKLVKSMPKLRIIIEVLSGVGPIIFIIGLLFLFLYILANICVVMLGNNDPMHFGRLHRSFASLFVVTTLDDWTDIMYANMLGCDNSGYSFGNPDLGFISKSDREHFLNCKTPTSMGWFAAFFMIILVTVSNFVLLNVFIGLVSIAMEESKVRQKQEAKVAKMLALRANQLGMSRENVELYQLVFDELDIRKDGKLDGYDLKALVRCLPMLHFAAAFVDEVNSTEHVHSEEVTEVSKVDKQKAKDFKVMNKKDIKFLMLLLNHEFGGEIDMPDFLIIMDFMRRVDSNPSLLDDFRESVENTIEEHDHTVEIHHQPHQASPDQEKEDKDDKEEKSDPPEESIQKMKTPIKVNGKSIAPIEAKAQPKKADVLFNKFPSSESKNSQEEEGEELVASPVSHLRRVSSEPSPTSNSRFFSNGEASSSFLQPSKKHPLYRVLSINNVSSNGQNKKQSPLIKRRSQYISVDTFSAKSSKLTRELHSKDLVHDKLLEEVEKMEAELTQTERRIQYLELSHGPLPTSEGGGGGVVSRNARARSSDSVVSFKKSPSSRSPSTSSSFVSSNSQSPPSRLPSRKLGSQLFLSVNNSTGSFRRTSSYSTDDLVDSSISSTCVKEEVNESTETPTNQSDNTPTSTSLSPELPQTSSSMTSVLLSPVVHLRQFRNSKSKSFEREEVLTARSRHFEQNGGLAPSSLENGDHQKQERNEEDKSVLDSRVYSKTSQGSVVIDHRIDSLTPSLNGSIEEITL